MYFNARIRDDPRTKSAQEMKNEEEARAKGTARTTEWRILHDTGSTLRTTISNLNMLGVCPEKAWPYGNWEVKMDSDKSEDIFIVTDEKGQPLKDGNGHPIWSTPIRPQNWSDVFAQARDSIPRAISFYRILDSATKVQDEGNQSDRELAWDINDQPPIALLEKCIIDGFPFSFGCQLYFTAGLNDDDWEDTKKRLHKQNIDDKGIFVKPPTDSTQLKKTDGRHALLAVGFDPKKRLFLIQNSWGTDWPQSIPNESERTGRFWMPYEWFENKNTYDFWVLKCSDAPLKGKPMTFNPAHWNYKNTKR